MKTETPLENKLAHTSAPFTSDRLHELYIVEGLSMPKIAAYASELRTDGKPTSLNSICQWLKLSGIQTRSWSAAQKLYCTQHSQKIKYERRSRTKKAIEAARLSEKHNAHAKASISSALKAWKKQCRRNRILYACALEGCNQNVSLIPARLKLSKLHFCSQSCRSRFYGHQRSIEAKIRKALLLPSPPSELDALSQQIFGKSVEELRQQVKS